MKRKIYRISGKSLEKELINDDDFVIVDEKETIKNDDMVALFINGGYLIKRFYKKDGHKMFYPFQRDYVSKETASAVLDKAKIIGKVVAIIKRWKRKKK